MKISKGVIEKPQKVVLYGVEGIGKSTFLSQFPSPLFLDVEGSTHRMDVARIDPAPISWTELLETVREFLREKPAEFATLCLDTADWAEMMCVKHVCDKAKKDGIESFGYGKGYVYVAEEFGTLLNLLEDVIGAGYNVAIAAHAKMRKFEQPDEMGAYDRWEMKLSKNVAPMLKEWADMVLFANYKTYSVAADEKGKVHKGQGGKRVMYTTHHPCWDGKNRHGLADELPFDFGQIAHCIHGRITTPPVSQPVQTAAPAPVAQPVQATVSKTETVPAPVETLTPPPAAPDVPEALRRLMEQRNIFDYEIREFIGSTGYFPKDAAWSVMEEAGFVDGYLVPNFDFIAGQIENDPDRLPF